MRSGYRLRPVSWSFALSRDLMVKILRRRRRPTNRQFPKSSEFFLHLATTATLQLKKVPASEGGRYTE